MIRMLCDILAIGAALFAGIQGAATANTVISDWVPLPYNLGLWGSGLVIAGLVFVIVSSIGKLLDRLSSTVGLGIFNRLAGFVFGCVKGFGLVVPLALILTFVAPDQLENSMILQHYSGVLSKFDGIAIKKPVEEIDKTKDTLTETITDKITKQLTDTMTEKLTKQLMQAQENTEKGAVSK